MPFKPNALLITHAPADRFKSYFRVAETPAPHAKLFKSPERFTLPALLSPRSTPQIGSDSVTISTQEGEAIHIDWAPLAETAGAPTGAWLLDAGGRLTTRDAEGEERVLYLHPLPRLVDSPVIVDNASPSYSLERAVYEALTSNDLRLKNLAITTGYLYEQGLRYILDLLDRHPALERIQLLFSGKIDKRTEEVLATSLKLLDSDSPTRDVAQQTLRLIDRFTNAIEQGRVEVRVYPAHFLHAKLFFAWNGIDAHGELSAPRAFIGSSNLTRPGISSIHSDGNLELNLRLGDGSKGLEDLHLWFQLRWEEARAVSLELLNVSLSATRERLKPLADERPLLHFKELLPVLEAGLEGKLRSAEEHLKLLVKQLNIQPSPLLPGLAAFPLDESRRLTPAPEQAEGVIALCQRLVTKRIAYLADGVGLGKTVTALGAMWYLQRSGRVRRAALLSPEKLRGNWEQDARGLRLPEELWPVFINRHKLERSSTDEELEGQQVELLIIEEAHESLRSRRNRLWLALKAYLEKHPRCLVLFVSATPWNNRRDDIFNALALGWCSARVMSDFPDLVTDVEAGIFTPGVKLATAAKRFLDLPQERYRRIFSEVFLQRTRYRLKELNPQLKAFPSRRLFPHFTPPSSQSDAFFDELPKRLATLTLGYREILFSVLGALNALGLTADESRSNLSGSFITQLYKRAESCFFALAVSLRGVRARLESFASALRKMSQAQQPRAELMRWLEERYLRIPFDLTEIDETQEEDLSERPQVNAGETSFRSIAQAEEVREDLSSAQTARLTRLKAVADIVTTDDVATRVLRFIAEDEVNADQLVIDALLGALSYELDAHDSKALVITRLLRDYQAERLVEDAEYKMAAEGKQKVIVVAGYADSAVRLFLRAIHACPTSRVGLALGGGEGWLYTPTAAPFNDLTLQEWETCTRPQDPAQLQLFLSRELDRSTNMLSGRGRRLAILKQRDALVEVEREQLIKAFAPKAQHIQPDSPLLRAGEIDILVGSDAISVGQNLQDATVVIHGDLPWQPMTLEQRIGRVDRRGGGRPDAEQQQIVDAHYIWSHDAIDQKLQLRELLKKKVRGVIEDTDFDDHLLQELKGEVEAARLRGAPATARVAELLEARQRASTQGKSGGDEFGGALKTSQGRALLREWRTRVEPPPLQSPPTQDAALGVGLGIAEDARGSRWLCTLLLQPLDPQRQPLGGPFLDHFVINLGEGQRAQVSQDLEIVVRDLISAYDQRVSPLAGTLGAEWRSHIERLDQRLYTLRDELLCAQQLRIKERVEAQEREATRHKERCGRAKAALGEWVLQWVQNPLKHAALEEISGVVGVLLPLLSDNPHLVGAHSPRGDVKDALERAASYPDIFLNQLKGRDDKLLIPNDLTQESLALASPTAEQVAWADLEVQVLAVAAAPATPSNQKGG